MKYTPKQQRIIDYFTKNGDTDKLTKYKKCLEERDAEKKRCREERKIEAAKAAKLVKVGDIFSCSWGYDQTNVNFFQIMKIIGKNSVRIRQVMPTCIQDDACGPMAADRTYAINNGEMLPSTKHSVFIKDQVNGDVKRIQNRYCRDEISPCIKLASFAWAYPESLD